MLVLAVEVEDLAAGELQGDQVGRAAVGGVPRPVELEGERAEVDEDGAGVRVGRVPVPGDSRVAADGEADLRLGAGMDALQDRGESGPEPVRGEAGALGLRRTERRLNLEPRALAALGLDRDVGAEVADDGADGVGADAQCAADGCHGVSPPKDGGVRRRGGRAAPGVAQGRH